MNADGQIESWTEMENVRFYILTICFYAITCVYEGKKTELMKF